MRRNGRLTACISASSKLLVVGARLETRHLCQIPPVDFIKPLRETSLHRRHCLRTSPRTLSAGNDPDRVPGLFWTAIKGWYVWQSFGRTPSPFQTISKFIYIYPTQTILNYFTRKKSDSTAIRLTVRAMGGAEARCSRSHERHSDPINPRNNRNGR